MLIATKKSSRRIALFSSVFVVGMFFFGYALVPIYNVLCSTLGINGKPSMYAAASVSPIDKTRKISVQFLTTNNASLPWTFYPLVTSVEIYPGENRRIDFYAKNETNRTMTVQAIPSVTPSQAARYLKKTECFCFTLQTFAPHQGMDMPLLFHIDRE